MLFQGTYGVHPIRERLFHIYNAEYLFEQRNIDWMEKIEKSNFTLTPLGYGYDSFRRWEALQLGSIPIYIYEDPLWLPYNNVIDWNDISLNIHINDIDSIKEKVSQLIRQEKVDKMIKNINSMKYMWTYEYCIQYIIRDLLSEQRLKDKSNKVFHRKARAFYNISNIT